MAVRVRRSQGNDLRFTDAWRNILRISVGAAFVRFLRRIVSASRLSERYRPELHYMRGPGPKSQGQKRLRVTGDGKSNGGGGDHG
jgi:hypothetical protein